MQPAHGTLHVFEDPARLADGLADWFVQRAREISGRIVVSLSGGSTPKALYRALSSSPRREQLPWNRLVWTFGDERFVPPDSPDSNYLLAKQAIFDPAHVDPAQLHAFQTVGISPAESSRQYERVIAGLAKPDGTLLDITILGMGDDGHTASLIPGQPVLDETTRLVAEVPQGRDEIRLTLTYPALAKSRYVVFLISGAGKAAALDRVLSGDQSLPAGRVRADGQMLWFVDREAAGRWAA